MRSVFSLAFLLIALSACGGGGSDSTAPNNGGGGGGGGGSGGGSTCTSSVTQGCVSGTTSNTFSPATVTINANGQVTWTFASQHSVIFDGSGAGKPTDIGATSSGSVSRTFTTAGSFPYHCGIHGTGMSGTITVQ